MSPNDRYRHRSEHLPHPGKVKINRARRRNPLPSFVTLKGEVFRMPQITTKWLLERVDIEGEHMIWKGYIQKHGSPQCRMALAPYKHKTLLVRRLVWANDNVTEELGEDDIVTAKCRRWGCVAPSCLEKTTHSALMKEIRPALSLAHKANLAASRRKNSRIPDDAIDVMRYSDKPTKELCEEFGVRREYVNQVRRGTLRKEYRPNMFSQLIREKNNADAA